MFPPESTIANSLPSFSLVRTCTAFSSSLTWMRLPHASNFSFMPASRAVKRSAWFLSEGIRYHGLSRIREAYFAARGETAALRTGAISDLSVNRDSLTGLCEDSADLWSVGPMTSLVHLTTLFRFSIPGDILPLLIRGLASIIYIEI